MASSSPEDIGGSSDSAPAPPATTTTTESSNQPTIAKDDLIELIRAVKFKNPDFSQRQVYQEIVTEIPMKFPQYADALNSNTLCLNDVKKAWKKAILQQQKQQDQNSSNNNSDLAERLRKITTKPEVYTVGLNTQDSDLSSTGSNVARDYVAKFLEEQEAANSAQQSQLLEDYVHVFLDVPMDGSGGKPHQALINFQDKPKGAAAKNSNGNNKKKKGKKRGTTTTSSTTTQHPEAPFEDAIVVKIQMAAPMGPDDTTKHPMLLYDQSRKFKTFVHPDGTLTAELDESEDGYSRLARWIRSQGVGGALGASGGTKAYFYARRTGGGRSNPILSIYVQSLAPPEAQVF